MSVRASERESVRQRGAARPLRRFDAPTLFAGLFGAFLGLALLKFGNPPIMEKWVSAPADIYEFLLGYPWPISWAYGLFIFVGVIGLFIARANRDGPRELKCGPLPPRPPSPGPIQLERGGWGERAKKWLIWLPLAWLAWQVLAGTQSIDAQLSRPTLKHFAVCVGCFYLGFFSLGRAQLLPFWLGMIGGLVLVLAAGFEQHFGGLEESRRYFFLYVYPKMIEPPPPEYLKKMMSTRIFSTLFYPNALAGCLLLLLPPIISVLWRTRRLTQGARMFVVAIIGLAGLACLYWSESKGGWLLMLLLGLIALLRAPFKRQYKVILLSGILALGLTGFFWKHSSFFRRGATSVSARFDYWQAAIQTAGRHPIFGTGPGTFAIPYQKIKRPESEMARLVHNDYLEQATDAGLPAFVLYVSFIVGCLVWTFPKDYGAGNRPYPANGRSQQIAYGEEDKRAEARVTFSIWLGLLGWSLQSLFEFGLYIPALAWPAFALLGRLLAGNRFSRGGK